jgi:cephalosporin-C deacetylase-like acetyl esterase
MTAAYWEELDAELAAVPTNLVLTPEPSRTTDEWTFSTITFSSIGHRGSSSYRAAGYLSVPTRPGPHPGVLEIPRHGSVNHTPHSNDRGRYAVLTLMHRGQRLADAPYRAPYPGLLIDGIADADEYVYRGIVADCLRAADILRSRPEVDTDRLAAVGEDLGVVTAARRPIFRAVRVDGLLLTDPWRRASSTRGYPMESLNDFARHASGADLDSARTTTALFEPLGHARDVRSAALVSDGSPAGAALAAALGGAAEVLVPTGRDRLDDDERDAWLAAQLGVPAMSRYADAVMPLPGE